MMRTRLRLRYPSRSRQTFRDWDVVFIRVGTTFEAVPIEIGRRDDEWIAVVGGVFAVGRQSVAHFVSAVLRRNSIPANGS